MKYLVRIKKEAVSAPIPVTDLVEDRDEDSLLVICHNENAAAELAGRFYKWVDSRNLWGSILHFCKCKEYFTLAHSGIYKEIQEFLDENVKL